MFYTPFFKRIVSPLVAAFIGVLSVPVSVAQTSFNELPDLGESARAELSPQLERRIGESIMNQIRLREPSYVDDPEVNDYLAQLGRRLVEASDNPTGEFHFFAIRDNTVNAFAMFGGFIGINTGTLLTAQSESELAGVMAHEIAHVTQNHLARQIARKNKIPFRAWSRWRSEFSPPARTPRLPPAHLLRLRRA